MRGELAWHTPTVGRTSGSDWSLGGCQAAWCRSWRTTPGRSSDQASHHIVWALSYSPARAVVSLLAILMTSSVVGSFSLLLLSKAKTCMKHWDKGDTLGLAEFWAHSLSLPNPRPKLLAPSLDWQELSWQNQLSNISTWSLDIKQMLIWNTRPFFS